VKPRNCRQILTPLTVALSLAACQNDESASANAAAPETNAVPRMVLLDPSPTTIVQDGKSVVGMRVQCKNWDSSYQAQVAGAPLAPGKDGTAFFPLPPLSDFCEIQMIVRIRTKTAVYDDTLRIQGDCDGEVVDPVETDPVKPASDLVFPFDKEGASQPSADGSATATVDGATWVSDPTGGHMAFAQGQAIDFGALFPDGQQQGAVSFRFKPDAAFLDRVASTILGNDGSRIHIGVVAGQLFFEKGHSDIHRFISSRAGALSESRWYEIRASWGAQGMILEVDGKPVAWSDDATAYQESPWGESWNHIWAGMKGPCCMEPLLIGSALYLTGELDDVRFSRTQPSIWGAGKTRACILDVSTTIPLCGTTAPVRNVNLW